MPSERATWNRDRHSCGDSLLGARRIRRPLVVIAGDSPMRRPTGILDMQSFDQRRFVESCEAHSKPCAAH
jgi:hypothetical protein